MRLGKRCEITVQNVRGKMTCQFMQNVCGKMIWDVILKTCLCYVMFYNIRNKYNKENFE